MYVKLQLSCIKHLLLVRELVLFLFSFIQVLNKLIQAIAK